MEGEESEEGFLEGWWELHGKSRSEWWGNRFLVRAFHPGMLQSVCRPS